jgi:hypothetical protein
MDFRCDSLCRLRSLSFIRNKCITFRENLLPLSSDLRIKSTVTQLGPVAAAFLKIMESYIASTNILYLPNSW